MKQAHQKPNGRTFGKPMPRLGELTLLKDHVQHHRQPFRPLPSPTGPAPYHLSLETILPAEKIKEIMDNKKLVFHAVGDTGGIQSGTAQSIVARCMHNDLQDAPTTPKPAFFYHLGDVVYYYGKADHYYGQFYDPYVHYEAPIFAIPGNHDGDLAPGDEARSLTAFVENFCAPVPEYTREAGDSQRQAMTQPHVYWTLEAPYATIIGLYTNVPEGGQLDPYQIAWLKEEMRTAPKEKALIVAMHHPIYSLDSHHSGSAYLHAILDNAMQETKRLPDLVLAGHVHNYQRFTRRYDGKTEIPYIVAGAGGYFHRHHEQRLNGHDGMFKIQDPTDATVQLEKFCDDRWGFLRLEVTKEEIKGTYLTVPLPHEEEAEKGKAEPLEEFVLSLADHRMKAPMGRK